MGIKTKIQWCDSTVNPSMGCDGCELWEFFEPKDREPRRVCYAGIMTNRFGGVTPGYPATFDQVTKYPGRMEAAAKWSDLTGIARPEKPWLWKAPRLIFVSDMGDSLSKDVGFDFLKTEVIEVVETEKGQRHHWLWLTKRPERMAQFSDWLQAQGICWPRNLWAGTSITSVASLGRIEPLLRVGNSRNIHFLSVEPQWEFVDLEPWMKHLQWIIHGGESGYHDHPFRIEWATDMAKLCEHYGVAYFLKQLGTLVTKDGNRLHLEDEGGGNWLEWDQELRIRQFPI
jgi:protein gp37